MEFQDFFSLEVNILRSGGFSFVLRVFGPADIAH